METDRPEQPHDPSEQVVATLARASQLARIGDFQAARRAVGDLRSHLTKSDQARLDAFTDSFRVDPSVWLIVAASLSAVGVVAALTLFH